MALSKPDHHPWTYADLLALPEDGRRYEIIEGALIEKTGPNWDHGTVVHNLVWLLKPLIEALGGLVRDAPLDVFLPGGDVVQPDVFAILPGGAQPSPAGLQGAPDLVVEVLSPTNRMHDLLTKRALYGRAGVREYWVADPVTRTVTVFGQADGTMRELGVAEESDTISSILLPDALLKAASIFAGLDAIQR
jgi:Uma2 family endonuclease